MKRQFKYSAITTIVFIVIILIINFNYYKIIYLKDSISGYLINTFEKIIPEKNNFTIINPEIYKQYKKTYKKLPERTIHTGPFLLYITGKPVSTKLLASKLIKYTNNTSVKMLPWINSQK